MRNGRLHEIVVLCHPRLAAVFGMQNRPEVPHCPSELIVKKEEGAEPWSAPPSHFPCGSAVCGEKDSGMFTRPCSSVPRSEIVMPKRAVDADSLLGCFFNTWSRLQLTIGFDFVVLLEPRFAAVFGM